MDCFYAAIEIRDNPALANLPVAVGGTPEKRGVICTCNYIARQFGVRSAMATAHAYRYCHDLVVLPVNMLKYKEASNRIHSIFREFTHLVEPIALDEAYLDVTESSHYRGSATLIAQAIREKIWTKEKLSASAGVAPNKFLAKIASGWKKPNGLYVIRPTDVLNFIEKLPVSELYGVGKVTAQKLYSMGLKTCKDLQKLPLIELNNHFGKFGQQLYDQCWGIDQRIINPNRVRKSLSVESTFPQDITEVEVGFHRLEELYYKLQKRIEEISPEHPIRNQFIKIKFSDFTVTTAEVISQRISLEKYKILFNECYLRTQKSIRLLGLGVHFKSPSQSQQQLLL